MWDNPRVSPTMATASMVMATATQLTIMDIVRLSFSGGVAKSQSLSSSTSHGPRKIDAAASKSPVAA